MSVKLFVGGLSWDTDDRALKSKFEEYGTVEDAVVIRDRENAIQEEINRMGSSLKKNHHSPSFSSNNSLSNLSSQQLFVRQSRSKSNSLLNNNDHTLLPPLSPISSKPLQINGLTIELPANKSATSNNNNSPSSSSSPTLSSLIDHSAPSVLLSRLSPIPETFNSHSPISSVGWLDESSSDDDSEGSTTSSGSDSSRKKIRRTPTTGHRLNGKSLSSKKKKIPLSSLSTLPPPLPPLPSPATSLTFQKVDKSSSTTTATTTTLSSSHDTKYIATLVTNRSDNKDNSINRRSNEDLKQQLYHRHTKHRRSIDKNINENKNTISRRRSIDKNINEDINTIIHRRSIDNNINEDKNTIIHRRSIDNNINEDKNTIRRRSIDKNINEDKNTSTTNIVRHRRSIDTINPSNNVISTSKKQKEPNNNAIYNHHRTKRLSNDIEKARNIINQRGRAKSRAREPLITNVEEQQRGRGKSRTREPLITSVEEQQRGRGKSRTREPLITSVEEQQRGRAKSKAKEPLINNIEEQQRGRAKSRNREPLITTNVEESPSQQRETRAKSKTRESKNGKQKSKGRSKDFDFADQDKHPLPRRDKTKYSENSTHIENSEFKQLTAQIYIEETHQSKKISITSEMTALDVLNSLRNNKSISDDDSWTIFELINEFGLERPIRDWEYLSRIIETWDFDRKYAFVLKKYPYRNALTIDGFNNAVPPMFGFLHMEVKKNKWQKRYFHVKDGSLYYNNNGKDTKSKTSDNFLCTMANFDVYSLIKSCNRKPPTKFVFALKSQDKITMFENPENDYIKYLCADHYDKMKDWVLSISTAKNNLMLAENPELFLKMGFKDDSNKDKIITEKSDSSLSQSFQQQQNVRSNHLGKPNSEVMFKEGSLLGSSDKNLLAPNASSTTTIRSLLDTNEALLEEVKEREKLRRALNGSGYVKDSMNNNTYINISESIKFNKGSLLDKNREIVESSSTNNTDGASFGNGSANNNNMTDQLIHIDEGIKFNKGSLLEENQEKKLSKKSMKTVGGGGGTLLTLDIPSPPSSSQSQLSTMQSPSNNNGKKLLEIDLKLDAQHTLALRNTNIQPLLSFVPSENKEIETAKSPRRFLFGVIGKSRNNNSNKNDNDNKLSDNEYNTEEEEEEPKSYFDF
ncbi:1908_t:CDS:10 [Entrophospora sp. SA101]|nr:1908_t:CDS:10 [Entrophospora sp. SA101]